MAERSFVPKETVQSFQVPDAVLNTDCASHGMNWVRLRVGLPTYLASCAAVLPKGRARCVSAHIQICAPHRGDLGATAKAFSAVLPKPGKDTEYIVRDLLHLDSDPGLYAHLELECGSEGK